MLDFLKRSRLVKRGLASSKTRRRRTRNEFLRSLEHSIWIRALIFAAFIGGLAALIFSGQQPEPTKNFVIALLFFVTGATQLWINQPQSFRRSSRVLLVFGIIFIQLAATKLILTVASNGSVGFIGPAAGPPLVSYAFAPVSA